MQSASIGRGTASGQLLWPLSVVGGEDTGQRQTILWCNTSARLQETGASDYRSGLMNHTRWVAWGVVDVDGTMDRQQRRNYLRKIREEMADIGCTFNIGGNKRTPYYII